MTFNLVVGSRALKKLLGMSKLGCGRGIGNRNKTERLSGQDETYEIPLTVLQMA